MEIRLSLLSPPPPTPTLSPQSMPPVSQPTDSTLHPLQSPTTGQESLKSRKGDQSSVLNTS